MLLFPIDVPQLEKWVSFVKGLPQDLKILFRVANAHANDLNAAAPLSLDGWWDIRTVRSKQSKKCRFPVRGRDRAPALQGVRSRQAGLRRFPKCADRWSAGRRLWLQAVGCGSGRAGTDTSSRDKTRSPKIRRVNRIYATSDALGS